MGWTNSVPIFHDDVNFILQSEIPKYTMPYIDDVPVRGPATRYEKADGTCETIPENDGIRRFIWEHMQNVNRIIQRMKYCGGTFSGTKSLLCAEEITVVGHQCTPNGRKPTTDRVKIIEDWGPCKDLSDVRAFLGTAGVLRCYISNYALRARHLQKLTRKDTPFEWGPDQEKSMAMLKEGVRNSYSLKPIDYEGQGAVVLAVDTSYIAVGYYIYQEDKDDPKKHYYAKFGSITLNEQEARYSQPKRELFGLKKALEANKKWLIGVRKLIVETDAQFIGGMLHNPDMMPNAVINRWIEQIGMYHFELRHKAGKTFGPDGLSRRHRQPADPEVWETETDSDPEDDDELTGRFKITIADPTEPPIKSINDFADKIDNRKGFMQQAELEEADLFRIQEKIHLENYLANNQAVLGSERCDAVQQLVNVLALPDDDKLQQKGPYPEKHRTASAIQQDGRIPAVQKWFANRKYRPKGLNEKEYKQFVRFANRFIMYEGRLYHRGQNAQHRLYVEKDKRMYMLTAAHDHVGHRGFYATNQLLIQRFWWPEMERDVNWFIKTCHVCQERQKTMIKIKPIITHTPSIFQTLHADVMHMTPASNQCGFIAHGRCAMTSWMEGRALRKQDGRSIGMWIWEDIICRWACIVEFVTDNGPAFLAAVRWLEEKYGIKGIRISPYNSQANGTVERPHWDVRQMLYKLLGEKNVHKWYWFLPYIMWADRITIRRRMGCSPFFMVTGAHPILPLDVKEATWLVKPPTGILTDDELIAFRAQALAKHKVHVDQMRKRIDQ
ncbi:hypothetical protein GALMADRAFT_82465, partial [Galerina marginata CBS 339.88]